MIELESEMEFLGISGVEDKLQDNINFTLENLKNAGINIWMLTGDKMETAKCIAISSGLKSK
jgi:phospholipid-translocating ATPase